MEKTCPNKKCPNSKMNYATLSFCPQCGEEFIEATKCKCGSYIAKMSNFCPHCGRPTK